MADNAERRAHTPGPWNVERGDSVLEIYAGASRLASVGTSPYWGRFSPTDAANAALIAAAPDLYEALRSVAAEHGAGARDDEVHLSSKTWGLVHAALARAEGRS